MNCTHCTQLTNTYRIVNHYKVTDIKYMCREDKYHLGNRDDQSDDTEKVDNEDLQIQTGSVLNVRIRRRNPE